MQTDASDTHFWHLRRLLAKAVELVTSFDSRWKQLWMSPDAVVEVDAIRLLVTYHLLVYLTIDG
jgi:hypothetical protein